MFELFLRWLPMPCTKRLRATLKWDEATVPRPLVITKWHRGLIWGWLYVLANITAFEFYHLWLLNRQLFVLSLFLCDLILCFFDRIALKQLLRAALIERGSVRGSSPRRLKSLILLNLDVDWLWEILIFLVIQVRQWIKCELVFPVARLLLWKHFLNDLLLAVLDIGTSGLSQGIALNFLLRLVLVGHCGFGKVAVFLIIHE